MTTKNEAALALATETLALIEKVYAMHGRNPAFRAGHMNALAKDFRTGLVTAGSGIEWARDLFPDTTPVDTITDDEDGDTDQ